MGKSLTSDQIRANERIRAWLNNQPYREYAEQHHPPRVVGGIFTPLASGRKPLAGVEIRR